MDFEPAVTESQKLACARYEAPFYPTPTSLKVGIAANVKMGLRPLNGLRHPPTADTSGWYIWAGTELSTASDFFQPLHAEHLAEWCPQILKFLGLPPGWRFLIAGDYEDAWFDKSLLDFAEGS